MVKTFIVIGAVALGTMTLNSVGVCIPTASRLNEKEILEAATLHAFHAYMSAVRSPRADIILGADHRTYDSFEAFIEANPDCCNVFEPGVEGWRDENEVSSWYSIRGLNRMQVSTTVDAGNGNYVGRKLIVANCGYMSSEKY